MSHPEPPCAGNFDTLFDLCEWLYRRIRRIYRRVRYCRAERIPLKYRHPVDMLIFYMDCIGHPPMTTKQEQEMRAHCDELVEVRSP